MNSNGKCWWKESVVYQIYPRSFNDSNGDGIGDIQGIIQKLDYLKTLGVDILWISPMYQSPNDDNGYDISDYRGIMDDFGSMGDFDELLQKAHEMGIRIIMDLVVNHTSDEHPWFIESKKSKENAYRDYYIWREGKDGNPPNNWGSWFGGSAWKYDETTDMYFLHIFSQKQPDLNWENPKVRDEVFDMMNWWLEKGIDGFRMDVISLISKVPGLPDGEVTDGLYGDLAPFCMHGPRVHEFLKDMNKRILSKYDIMTVGEATGVSLKEAPDYAGYDRNELNTVFQFEHVESSNGIYGKWTDKRFQLRTLKDIFTKWEKGMEGKAWNCLFWSNHDQPRAVTRFGNDSKEYREVSAKMIATCLHMMQGTPYIYQGEELGMTNAYFDELKDYRDIETFQAYDKMVNKQGQSHEKAMSFIKCIGRDNARTPMQWNNESNAGFTTGTPWININKNYVEINAKNQIQDMDSIYNYYKKLIRLRHEKEIIVYGTYDLILPDNEDIFAYTRTMGQEILLILCNFTEKTLSYELPEELKTVSKTILINNYLEETEGRLKPYQAKVYEIFI